MGPMFGSSVGSLFFIGKALFGTHFWVWVALLESVLAIAAGEVALAKFKLGRPGRGSSTLRPHLVLGV
jgi:hypothetical protein